LIYEILRQFYHEAANRPLLTGMAIAHQTVGDVLRWTPHFHAGCRAEQQPEAATRPIVLEGDFDDEGTFFYIPFSEGFARNLLSWKHSGFNQDAGATSH